MLTMSFLMSVAMTAQDQIYIGFEVGATKDIYEFSGNENHITPAQWHNATWGLTLRKDLNDFISLETGITWKSYYEGYTFHFLTPVISGSSSHISNSYTSWQIPLRIRSKIHLSKDKVFLTPILGYQWCIASNNIPSVSTSQTSINDFMVSSSNTTTFDSERTFSLLETGLGLEFRILKKAIFTASASYFTGFKKVMNLDIAYEINDEPITHANMYSKGEYRSFTFGVRYMISDLWSKK